PLLLVHSRRDLCRHQADRASRSQSGRRRGGQGAVDPRRPRRRASPAPDSRPGRDRERGTVLLLAEAALCKVRGFRPPLLAGTRWLAYGEHLPSALDFQLIVKKPLEICRGSSLSLSRAID